MGVNSLGYREWDGPRASPWSRAYVITRAGVRRAWSSRWLRRMLFFAWLPTLVYAFFIFAFEKSQQYPDLIEVWAPLLRFQLNNPKLDRVAELIQSLNVEEARHDAWALLLQSFFRTPQGISLTLIVGLIAPPLISQDIRSRAFLLYFSRPINRLEYLVGKLATVWFYIAMITMVPALVLYGLGVLLSPDTTVIISTWDIPLRIVAATCSLAIPTAALALCFSSMTQESRNATFAWFAVWILGWVTFGIMSTVSEFNGTSDRPVRVREADFEDADFDEFSGAEFDEREFSRDNRRRRRRHRRQQMSQAFNETSVWSHLSFYHTLRRVQTWIFGFSTFKEVWSSVLVLGLVTGLALVVLSRRIMAPMRA